MKKRPQGRPTKDQRQESGRDRLLAGLLTLVRSQPALASQRVEVARAAGVTPSLVCYYFPDHLDMIEAATEPVVEAYRESLLATLAASDDDDAKLRAIILLFIDTHALNPNVVDYYVSVVGKRADGSSKVQRLLQDYEALSAFFRTAQFSQFKISAEPNFLVLALWGLCRGVAQEAALPVAMDGGPAKGEQLVNRVLSLITGRGPDVSATGSTDPAPDPSASRLSVQARVHHTFGEGPATLAALGPDM